MQTTFYEVLPDIQDEDGEVTLVASFTPNNGIRIGLQGVWSEFDFNEDQAEVIGQALIRWAQRSRAEQEMIRCRTQAGKQTPIQNLKEEGRLKPFQKDLKARHETEKSTQWMPLPEAPETQTTLPVTNRLFARRVAYMASSAAKMAADSLDLELDAPVGPDIIGRFAEKMRGWIERMERDCAGR